MAYGTGAGNDSGTDGVSSTLLYGSFGGFLMVGGGAILRVGAGGMRTGGGLGATMADTFKGAGFFSYGEIMVSTSLASSLGGWMIGGGRIGVGICLLLDFFGWG